MQAVVGCRADRACHMQPMPTAVADITKGVKRSVVPIASIGRIIVTSVTVTSLGRIAEKIPPGSSHAAPNEPALQIRVIQSPRVQHGHDNVAAAGRDVPGGRQIGRTRTTVRRRF